MVKEKSFTGAIMGSFFFSTCSNVITNLFLFFRQLLKEIATYVWQQENVME